MPPRSPKMNRRIFGFQRRVWWPKWTPASSIWRIVTTAMTDRLLSCGWRAGPAAPPRWRPQGADPKWVERPTRAADQQAMLPAGASSPALQGGRRRRPSGRAVGGHQPRSVAMGAEHRSWVDVRLPDPQPEVEAGRRRADHRP